MLTRTKSAFALSSFVAVALFAAGDPFCGKWKLNQEKSKFTGEQMKIEDLGNNKFKFTSGNDSDTVTANGTDQPIHYGDTMSLAKKGTDPLENGHKKGRQSGELDDPHPFR